MADRQTLGHIRGQTVEQTTGLKIVRQMDRQTNRGIEQEARKVMGDNQKLFCADFSTISFVLVLPLK